MVTVSTRGEVVPSPRLSRVRVAAYGLGDFSSQLIWTTTGTYLAIFYTDVVGLAVEGVAVLLLATRLLDAIIDPAIGALAERTRSRYGRFRPWVLFGSAPLALLMILTFTDLHAESENTKYVWAAATYGLLGILYSVVNLPIGALAGVISSNPSDRISLGSARMVGTNLGIVLLSFVTAPLIAAFSAAGGRLTGQGYQRTAILMAVLAFLLLLVVFATTREAVQPVKTQMLSLRDSIRATVTNRPLLLISLSLLLGLTAYFGRIGVSVYFVIYGVQRPDLIPVLLASPAIASVVGILLFARFAERWGRRRTVIVSFAWQAIALAALWVVGFHSVSTVIIFSSVFGLGFFGFPVLIGMIPDAIDYAEQRTGIRADGVAYAVSSFATKVASALGAAAALAALGAFGYVANSAQSDLALRGINIVTNLGPALLLLAAIIPLIFYLITDTQTRSIRQQLNQRQQAAAASDLTPTHQAGTQARPNTRKHHGTH